MACVKQKQNQRNGALVSKPWMFCYHSILGNSHHKAPLGFKHFSRTSTSSAWENDRQLYCNKGNQIIGSESGRVGESFREIIFTMYTFEESQMIYKVLSKHGE